LGLLGWSWRVVKDMLCGVKGDGRNGKLEAATTPPPLEAVQLAA